MLKTFFKTISEAMGGSEKWIIDLLSIFVPYAVPVIPAYLTFYHTQNEMDFPVWVAWTAAFVVEALGFSSVATAVRFWKHNQKYSADKNRAPFGLAVAVYVFYIVVVIVVNVVLELVSGIRGGWVIFAIALFSTLSFPASVLVSIRYIHSDILEERQSHRNNPSSPKPEPKQRTRHASQFKVQIRKMLEDEYASTGRILAPKEITSALKLDHDRSKGFVSTETSRWKAENGIRSMGFPERSENGD